MAKDVVLAQAERIIRASELVSSGAYVQTAQSVFVYSDQPGVPGYEVDLGTMRCSCKDATVGWASRHLNGICKHIEAARMLAGQRASQYAGVK